MNSKTKQGRLVAVLVVVVLLGAATFAVQASGQSGPAAADADKEALISVAQPAVPGTTLPDTIAAQRAAAPGTTLPDTIAAQRAAAPSPWASGSGGGARGPVLAR